MTHVFVLVLRLWHDTEREREAFVYPHIQGIFRTPEDAQAFTQGRDGLRRDSHRWVAFTTGKGRRMWHYIGNQFTDYAASQRTTGLFIEEYPLQGGDANPLRVT